MIEFTREMNRNYVKILPEEESKKPDYCMKMVENNPVKGLLKLTTLCVNDKVSCLYEISGRISLYEKYAAREFSAADMEYIIGFLRGMIQEMERFMLDPDGLLLDPKYIFCGIGTGEWELVYSTCFGEGIQRGLKGLFEFILNRLDHKEQKAVLIGYALYKRVCQEEMQLGQIFEPVQELIPAIRKESDQVIEYEETEKVYDEIMPERITQERERESYRLYMAGCGAAAGVALIIFGAVIIPAVLRLRAGTGGAGGLVFGVVVFALMLSVAAVSAYMVLSGKRNPAGIVPETADIPYSRIRLRISGQKRNEGQADILCKTRFGEAGKKEPEEGADDCQTVLLCGKEYARLVRLDSGNAVREYFLEDSPLCLGSGSQADIVLEDEGISRIHARISKEGEMLFIKDMNSTNGTWVNDRRLTVYELCPVKNGDIIKLAGSRFELFDTVS